MNKQKFYKVSADTEISVLKALLREGRLYASSSSEELAISEAIRMLRNIHSDVSPEYEANIGKILKAIFSIPTIKKRMLYKKGKVAGTTNFATVAMVLKYMQGRCVFLCNFSDLLREVFGNDNLKKNTNKSCYALSSDEESRIKAFLLNFSSKRHKS